MADDFGKQTRDLAARYERRLQAAFAISASEVLRIASVPKAQGGRMPVDTGNLRSSVIASTEGKTGQVGGSDPALVFALMKVGQTVWVGWTAAYAMRMEYGFRGADKLGRVYDQQGNHFLSTAVQQWPQIVDGAVRQAQAIR